jgi:hypothetical protein
MRFSQCCIVFDQRDVRHSRKGVVVSHPIQKKFEKGDESERKNEDRFLAGR